MRARSARWTLGPTLLGALALTAPGIRAQGHVHAATLRADLTGAEARVELTYELRGIGAGGSVDVSLLDFGAAGAGDVRVGPSRIPLTLTRAQGAARGGSVPVEQGADGLGRISFAYAVPLPDGESGALVAHLPVITVDLPPEEARPGLFQAELSVPDGWRVTEGFPTGMARGGGAGSLEAQLQLVPSVVTVRARTDGSRRPGLLFFLDVVATAGLVLFSVAGWRHITARSA